MIERTNVAVGSLRPKIDALSAIIVRYLSDR